MPSVEYLSAERLGPRDQLRTATGHPEDVRIGTRGEYTAQVLAMRRDTHVTGHRRNSGLGAEGLRNANRGLLRQTEAWLSEIVKPVRLAAEQLRGVFTSTVRFEEPSWGELTNQQIRPANMGFGLTYSLPIIVAGLVADEGDLLIVENPEAHLHPAGQSRLGAFLARVAGSGVQVVVETHSDHVLNGIRLAATAEQAIAPDKVVFHFVGSPSGSSTPIGLTAKGGLTEWPEGFFDQLDLDLGRLAQVKRGE